MNKLVYWKEEPAVFNSNWHLMVRNSLRTKKWRIAATVYPNGIWHTFNQDGVGGENWKEDTIKKAKIEAAASAIAQGFI